MCSTRLELQEKRQEGRKARSLGLKGVGGVGLQGVRWMRDRQHWRGASGSRSEGHMAVEPTRPLPQGCYDSPYRPPVLLYRNHLRCLSLTPLQPSSSLLAVRVLGEGVHDREFDQYHVHVRATIHLFERQADVRRGGETERLHSCSPRRWVQSMGCSLVEVASAARQGGQHHPCIPPSPL